MRMTRRWIRQVIWICTGLTVGCVIFVLYLRFFSGTVYRQVVSPDRRYIVEWREYCGFAAATDSCLDSIELKTRYNPVRHPVFQALRMGRPSIAWLNSQTLVLDCPNCGDFAVKCATCDSQPYIVGKENRWHDVTIRYGRLDDTIDLVPLTNPGASLRNPQSGVSSK